MAIFSICLICIEMQAGWLVGCWPLPFHRAIRRREESQSKDHGMEIGTSARVKASGEKKKRIEFEKVKTKINFDDL